MLSSFGVSVSFFMPVSVLEGGRVEGIKKGYLSQTANLLLTLNLIL